MISTLLKVRRSLTVCCATLAVSISSAFAQMPNDAIYMGSKTACLAVSYNHSSWDKYWENSLKRSNLNIGTHTTQSVMPMLAVGIVKNLNLIVALPYVWTQASTGNLMWQRGFQDASGWLKYRFVNVSGFSLHAIAGGSVPITNYVADFMPMSIGMQCKTATARLLASYRHKSGIYLTAHASYIFRSNIQIDRDSYQADDKLYSSNQVRVPNAYDGAVRLGYLKRAIQAEGYVETGACDGGDYIRRNDMPFPTNNMKSTTVGVYAKYQPKNIGVNARAAYVVAGSNVGQTTAFSAGVLYQFRYAKADKK
ncbi:hypothetical protein DYBT9623_03985 [Dyadobacter sp. CECT 9623]|uniref:Outer membrane protein beta-barrel domain-containing protein n=1 Tax=Dyadobacter linearis TaxID=2823330 RepID=A0ABN7RGS2_9BACT|nr:MULTISPECIES: hypothetical protein [unclassified Dyadobacter]MCE7059671.1 hypothetical protein [Dyadobacter sp. CY343]CAG5072047.1 hypothetical protein DYBT9623_03985 [Dyadobacter sp. CECT 9623]